jgi:RNA-directed DNA polymerase
MHSSHFEENSFKHLGAILHISTDELKWVLDNIDTGFYEYAELKRDKITGKVKMYSDGTPKKRIITRSRPRLRAVQDAIKNNILNRFGKPDHIQGSVKGKSNITNAKIHLGKKFKLTTDLKDFFPTVTTRAVYNVFLSMGFNNHQSRWLTIFTTYKSRLPQGSPTSPDLANMAFIDTDIDLLVLCKKHGMNYSRYVDDLTFSSQKDFKNVIPEIIDILRAMSFKISHRKTFYKPDQTITGVDVFNNFIDAPRSIKERAQNEVTTSGLGPVAGYMNRIRKTNSNVRIGRLKQQ